MRIIPGGRRPWFARWSSLIATFLIMLGVLASPTPSGAGNVTLTVDQDVVAVPADSETITFTYTLKNGTGQAIVGLDYAYSGVGGGLPDPGDSFTIGDPVPPLPAMLAPGASFTFTRTGMVADYFSPNPGDAVWTFNTAVTYNPGDDPKEVQSQVTVIVYNMSTPELSPGPMAGALILSLGSLLVLSDRFGCAPGLRSGCQGLPTESP